MLASFSGCVSKLVSFSQDPTCKASCRLQTHPGLLQAAKTMSVTESTERRPTALFSQALVTILRFLHKRSLSYLSFPMSWNPLVWHLPFLIFYQTSMIRQCLLQQCFRVLILVLAATQSMDPYCKALGVRLPYMVHSSHSGSVPNCMHSFGITSISLHVSQSNLAFSCRGTHSLVSLGKLLCISVQEGLHLLTTSLGMSASPWNTSVVPPLLVGIWTNLDCLLSTARGFPANTSEGEATTGLQCWVTSWHRTHSTIIQLHAKY